MNSSVWAVWAKSWKVVAHTKKSQPSRHSGKWKLSWAVACWAKYLNTRLSSIGRTRATYFFFFFLFYSIIQRFRFISPLTSRGNRWSPRYRNTAFLFSYDNSNFSFMLTQWPSKCCGPHRHPPAPFPSCWPVVEGYFRQQHKTCWRTRPVSPI